MKSKDLLDKRLALAEQRIEELSKEKKSPIRVFNRAMAGLFFLERILKVLRDLFDSGF